MLYARKEIQITVGFKNHSGRLKQLFDVLTRNGVGVLAHANYPSRDWTVVLLIVDNLDLARSAFDEGGFEHRSDFVVLADVPDRSWIAAQAGVQLNAVGIGILYSYVSDPKTGLLFAVFKTTDDSRAVRVLQNSIPSLAHHQSTMPIEGGSHATAFRS